MKRLLNLYVIVLSLCLTWGVSIASAQKKDGTLVMLVQPEPSTLASYLSTAGPIGQVSTKVYEGLLEYDFNLVPQPSLAESWDVTPDGMKITFKLRQGVTFHDGSPFDSEDVRFSIMDVLKKFHPRGSVTFRDVQDIETPDIHTVVMILSRPAPYLLSALSSAETPMLSSKVFAGEDPKGHSTANAPIGTGPFKFVEWRKGQFILLERNEDYWKEGLPYLNKIVARFIGDSGTRAAAIENGEIHYAAFGAIANVDARRLEASDKIVVTSEGYTMINPMMLLEVNTKGEYVDNQSVRQAISYAIDRQFIVDNIFFGYGKAATGSISSNFEPLGFYSTDVVDYAVADRLEIAKSLLDDAGYVLGPDGTRFSIVFDVLPYGEQWQRLGEYIKQTLGDIGIEVTLRYEDPPTWLNRIYTDYDYQLNSTFFYQLSDPVLGLHRQFLSDQIRPGTVFVNGAQYSNPIVDELLNDATTSTQPEERKRLYNQFQRIVSEELPIIPIFEMEFLTVYNKKVVNAIGSPLGAYSSFSTTYINE